MTRFLVLPPPTRPSNTRAICLNSGVGARTPLLKQRRTVLSCSRAQDRCCARTDAVSGQMLRADRCSKTDRCMYSKRTDAANGQMLRADRFSKRTDAQRADMRSEREGSASGRMCAAPPPLTDTRTRTVALTHTHTRTQTHTQTHSHTHRHSHSHSHAHSQRRARTDAASGLMRRAG